MPLHVEILYNEYNFAAAFAVASLLALLALVTLAPSRSSSGDTGTRSRRRAAALSVGQAMDIRVAGDRQGVRRDRPRYAVSLEVAPGELLALLGPSGSGKTTLLRIIAGLEIPDRGHVLFDGEDATAHAVQKRQVGFVFQHYALFRHLTVRATSPSGCGCAAAGEPAREAEIRAACRRAARPGPARGL